MPKAASEKVTKVKKDDGKEKKLSPYMQYMKVTIAQYKAENPGVAHKDAFSKVASMWADADENPNKGKPKAEKKPAGEKKKAAPKKSKKAAPVEEASGGDDDADDE